MTTLLTSGSTVKGRAALDDDVDLARDRVLVTRAQDGDRSAFDDLYLRYYRRLYRFCLRRLHDAHEAEDVAQEAFARAWRALPTFGGDRRFYPWLSVIASHLCTDVLRRRNRSTPVAEFHQGNVASTEDGGEELMIAAVDSALVVKAFGRLSERHQRILNLREGSGWSYQRIADHEGVGITAVETLLWRARQALKREFASLAGADGRSAAFIGAGLFSMASLRRLLGAPLHAARRIGQSGPGTALAMGSAAAATAVVVVASVGALPSPLPTSTPATPVATGASRAPAPRAHAVPTSPAPVGSPGSAAAATPLTPVGSALAPLGTGALGTGNAAAGAQVVVGTVEGLGTTLGNTLRGLGSTTLSRSLSSTVGGAAPLFDAVAGAVTSVAAATPTGAAAIVSGPSPAAGSAVTAAGSALGHAIGAVVQTPGTAGAGTTLGGVLGSGL
jgi:RNA polymerase sigma-70 factor (ECF subfamily)